MLAYLKHFNLSLQQLLILNTQLLFLNNLDCNFLLCLLMNSPLDNPVFALAQGLLQLIEIVEVCITD